MLIEVDGNPSDIDTEDVKLTLAVGNPLENPVDIVGTDVTLALALGNPDSVELWNPDRFETLGRVNGGTVGIELLYEIVGSPEGDDVADPEVAPTDVLFEEIIGNPDEADPPDEALLDKNVGSPDGWEAGIAAEALLLADIVGSPDGVEMVGNPIDELLDDVVGNPEKAVELWYPDRYVRLGKLKGGIVPEELLAELARFPDGAEEVPL